MGNGLMIGVLLPDLRSGLLTGLLWRLLRGEGILFVRGWGVRVGYLRVVQWGKGGDCLYLLQSTQSSRSLIPRNSLVTEREFEKKFGYHLLVAVAWQDAASHYSPSP
jgi:hypothetical protein